VMQGVPAALRQTGPVLRVQHHRLPRTGPRATEAMEPKRRQRAMKGTRFNRNPWSSISRQRLAGQRQSRCNRSNRMGRDRRWTWKSRPSNNVAPAFTAVTLRASCHG
jgi:hypothetical protein